MQQSKLAKNKMMAQTSYILSQFKIKALRIVNLIQSCVPKSGHQKIMSENAGGEFGKVHVLLIINV